MAITEEETTALQKELESTRAELAATKAAFATVQNQLAERNAVIKPLEQELAAGQEQLNKMSGQVTALHEEAISHEKSLVAANEALVQAIHSYKTLAAAAHPDIPAELITGDTVADINASLKKAQGIVSKIAANVPANLARGKLPAVESRVSEPPDTAALSPREKIHHGLSQRKIRDR